MGARLCVPSERETRHVGSRKREKRRRQARKGARLPADPHVLYQEAVQSPESDIEFASGVFLEWTGREPRVLREDFCGTALLAAEWVRSRQDRSAVAVDLDAATLGWAEEHNRRPLGEAATRLQLVEGDVRQVSLPPADLLLALNFSYFCFHARDDLLAYFRAARRGLAPDGLFVIDVFGGTESMELLEEATEKDGFTYIWDQDEFDPLTHSIRCYIHFRLDDGTKLKRAFTYDWRLWTVPELRDALSEAGFDRVETYWEGFDEDGEGTGDFRRVDRGEPCEGFVCYLVASGTEGA